MLYISGFLLVLTVSFSGCAREVYNVVWEGVVADELTGKPVPHARISASASYQQNIDETAELNQYSLSDEYGRFKLAFPRAFGLTLRVSAPGYLSGLQYKTVKKAELGDTLFISPNPFNASLVVRKMDLSGFSPDVPFVREIHFQNNIRTRGKSPVRWGFDFLSGRNTLNLDSADIWVVVNEQNGRILLNASSGGGIFPVVEGSSEEFLLGYTQAPDEGYQKSYMIKGDEAGFFVLCRNGVNVAKMIPENKICILSYTNSAGQRIQEKGIRFNYLFQPDLKNRLSFPVSASVIKVEKAANRVSN
ncbi:carboxypeptidase-like regulatory domain-containing protein [Thermophagus sp. OGC60D27]|uniref:carboxypeptidase-like regulatory domain-containing protein n=1 Tax=Thermophagus sp. OGC60D27 TaxID=3458415 RepID=UPI0040381D79